MSWIVTSLARLYPWAVDPGEELRLAIDFLDGSLSAETIVRAGYGAGLVVTGFVGLAILLVPAQFRIATLLGAVAVGLCTVHAVHAGPKLLATARRTSALGTAPDLVARAVLSMRLAPTPERAAAFTAKADDGILAASLERHVRQSEGTAESGLVSFGETWGELFPSLRRACGLVAAAGQTPARDRDRLLDRALRVVLDGTREQMQSFASRIRAPATALYAFGVLLPTALVALVPAAGAAGLPITPLGIGVVYGILLPAVLLVASIWLLAHRPVAFPPPNVSTEHPAVEDRHRVAILAGTGGTVAGWLAGEALLPPWGAVISSIGVGTGLTLWVYYWPVVRIYERVRRAEETLPDALALVGRRVANGRAVETAIEHAGAELDGEMGTLLATGARQQRQLQVGVRQAFLGRHGALRTLPSPRIRGSFALLGLAADEGRPAGAALLTLAEHVEDLGRIEQESRHSLEHVCRTLRSTGSVFAPAIAGSTVALADGIDGGGFLPGGEQSLPWLGAIVGWYVLVLAVLLTALATGLTRGLDRSLVGYRVGRTLVAATVTYAGAYLLVGTVV